MVGNIPFLLGDRPIGSQCAGDLGAIDAKFDVAVSTAASALDYIVVDDTPTAQHCVDLLRDRKLGVATFLILDKQAHLAPKASEKASAPEGAGPCPSSLYLSHQFPGLGKDM